jgi:lipooligosaccharide transport system permease protein
MRCVFSNGLPLTHAIALVRPLAAGLPLSNVLLHLSVLIAYAAIGFLIATHFTRKRLMG